MPELIPSHAWSFLRGRNRDAETALWTQFARAADALDGVALHNRVEVVVATALELRAVEQLTRPLPFALHAPFNQLWWPPESEPDMAVAADEWAVDLLATLFGPLRRPLASAADGLVIVDGHLLDAAQQALLAQRLQVTPGLLLMPPGVRVPAAWQAARAAGRLEVVPTGCASPATPTAVEERISEGDWRQITVAGAGPRLLPAVIGVCDIALFRSGGAQEQPYSARRRHCAEHIGLAAECSAFPAPALPAGATRRTALRAVP